MSRSAASPSRTRSGPVSAMPSLTSDRRGRHELDRLLDQALVAEEQLLLDGVLRVVARVDLVRDELDDVVAGRRHVEVDDDPAAEVAQVVVERPPGLVADLPRLERLARRQVDEPAVRRAARRAARSAGHRPLSGRRCRLAARPRSARRAPRPAGARRAARGRPRRPRCARARPDAVAALDLVGVREPLAGEHARVGAQPERLVAQPAVLELGSRASPSATSAPARRRLGVDLLLQLRRAAVGVDQPVDVLARAAGRAERSPRPRSTHARTAPPGPGRRRRTSSRAP